METMVGILNEREFASKMNRIIDKAVEKAVARVIEKLGKKEEDEIWKSKDIQRIFGLSHSTVHRHTQSGYFPSYKMGHSRIYKKSEVIAIMEQGYNQCA